MNKLGVVLGIAAVATLAGCKDPDFKRSGTTAQNEVKNAAPVSHSVVIEPTAPKCTCPPGTKHAKPCACGASDCKCVVEVKPVITADLSKPVVTTVDAAKPSEAKPVEPEYTIYVVQSGDYLAKISKKYNVTIAAIKRLNPSIKNDVIFAGQKIKLPGKVDVPAPAAGSTATAQKKAKAYAPYAGATKEYVVKSGDTLGSIAYGNGINIRQLKELNGLSSDSLKIGQKLKIPAEKVAKNAAAPVVEKKVAAPVVAEKKPVSSPVEVSKPAESAPAAVADAAPVVPAKDPEPVVDEVSPAADIAAPAATTTYIVQEGDDMTGVSIRWGVPAAEIRELNNLGENDQLLPGQVIKLPADAQQ